MKQNVKKYKNEITTIFQQASRVYRTIDFDAKMKELKKIHKRAYRDLIQANVHKWFRAYCSMRCYSMMMSNIDESNNSALKHACKLPIMTLVEIIHSLMRL